MPLSFVARLTNLAEEKGIDTADQFDISTRVLGVKKAWGNLMKKEAQQLLTAIENGEVEEVSTINESVTTLSQNEDESVRTSAHSEVHVSTEQRKQRAIILDAKLEDALLESYQYMAEIIDEKLYKELGYDSAREYFQDKQITVNQAYKYALIGRTYKPYLSDPKHRETFAKLGTSKIESIARNLDEQIPQLMDGGSIVLGDEEYSVDDLNEISYRQFKEEIKKANKKLEQYEVEVEKRKNAELERDSLAKEVKEMADRDAKYRERSDKEDQIEQDLKEASKAFERLQVLMTRIEPELLPERLEFQTVALIDSLPKAYENLTLIFSDILFKHNDVV